MELSKRIEIVQQACRSRRFLESPDEVPRHVSLFFFHCLESTTTPFRLAFFWRCRGHRCLLFSPQKPSHKSDGRFAKAQRILSSMKKKIPTSLTFPQAGAALSFRLQHFELVFARFLNADPRLLLPPYLTCSRTEVESTLGSSGFPVAVLVLLDNEGL
nr:hypothetical protein CFP56_63492 [Quercus suber]